MIVEDLGFFCVCLVYWKFFVIYVIIVKLDKNFKKIFLSVLFIIGYYVVKIIYIDILLYSK